MRYVREQRTSNQFDHLGEGIQHDLSSIKQRQTNGSFQFLSVVAGRSLATLVEKLAQPSNQSKLGPHFHDFHVRCCVPISFGKFSLNSYNLVGRIQLVAKQGGVSALGYEKKKPCIHSPWVWAFLPIVPRKVTLCSQPICLVEGELSQFLECSLEKRLIKKHQLGWSPEISFWSDFVIFFGGKMEFSSSTNHHIRLHNLGFIPRRGKQKLVISSFHCSQAFKGIF